MPMSVLQALGMRLAQHTLGGHLSCKLERISGDQMFVPALSLALSVPTLKHLFFS